MSSLFDYCLISFGEDLHLNVDVFVSGVLTSVDTVCHTVAISLCKHIPVCDDDNNGDNVYGDDNDCDDGFAIDSDKWQPWHCINPCYGVK